MSLPFSASADRNKTAIGDALTDVLNRVTTVLEIGSGTGQHAVYLAERFPNLQWQPTDRSENLTAIQQYIEASTCSNILPPIEIDVADKVSLNRQYDLAYSANTAHIMSLAEVKAMFELVSASLHAGASFALYGPFSYGGKHTSDGNRNFNEMLQQQAAHMGIRDKAELDTIALDAGLDFIDDKAMPSNNRILLWRR